MRSLIVVAVFLAGAGWLLFQNPAHPPRTVLHERLADELGAPKARRQATVVTHVTGQRTPVPDERPARRPESLPVTPPALGERASPETLRGEAMQPDGAARIVSARRVDAWVVYTASNDRGDGPRLNPLVGQSAVILDRLALYTAHAVRATEGALWIVEMSAPASPVAHAGDAAAVLVAAGTDARACVFARRSGRVLVFAAAGKTDALTLRFDFEEIEVTEVAPPEPPVAAGTIASAPKPADVRVARHGATFVSALPDGMPAAIPVLGTAALRQALTTVAIEGTEVPVLVAFDGHAQVAGRLQLAAAVAAPPVTVAHVEITSLVPAGVLPALGADGLVHSVPEVTP